MLLSACARENYDCPALPVAGSAVADELEALPVENYPALIDWIQRIDRYASALEE